MTEAVLIVAGAVLGAVATNSEGLIEWGAYGAIGFFTVFFLVLRKD